MSVQRRKTKPRKRPISETEYLLRSPKNAERLFASLQEARRGGGIRMSVEELRREVGLTPRQ